MLPSSSLQSPLILPPEMVDPLAESKVYIGSKMSIISLMSILSIISIISRISLISLIA